MAPAIVRSGGRDVSAPVPPARELSPEQIKAATMLAMLRQAREHVVQNFEDVGERFPDEVRRMHRQETEHRDVYGKATPKRRETFSRRASPSVRCRNRRSWTAETAAAAILEAAKPADDASGIVTHRANRQS